MGSRIGRICIGGGLLALAAWIASSNSSPGDWVDSQGAIQPLIHGHLSAYLSARPMMGPLPPLLEAPFAALGTDTLSEYRWACVPDLLAAGALGLYLAAVARRRGGGNPKQLLLALLPLLNPLTFAALRMGHPEEILTASLAIAALLVAAEDRPIGSGVLLGLALASKQWAVIAILPTLLLLPRARLRGLGVALAIPAALYLPGVIAAPSTFLEVQTDAGSAGHFATPWSAWYPLSQVEVRHLGGGLTATVHQLPAGAGALSHPLIVLLFLATPLALCLWRGRFALTRGEAFALLALLSLLRCGLDPLDNAYYHLPLLLALLGWDAVSDDRLPYRGLLGVGFALLLWRWFEHLGNPAAFNTAYLAIIGAAVLAILASLIRRQPGFTGESVAPATG